MNYIEIPFHISYSITDGKITVIQETGFTISCLFFSKNQVVRYADEISDPEAQNFKRFDYPWIISVKSPINFTRKKNLEIGFRFSYSPFSIHKSFKTKSIGDGQDKGMHHMTYGIQLEHMF